MTRATVRLIAACTMGTLLCSLASEAQATPPPVLITAPDSTGTPGPGSSGIFAGLQKSGQLLGTIGGLRPALSKHGISLNASETSEALGNVAGGIKHGFAYDGVTTAVMQLDTQRAFNLYGGTANISALQIHGRNLSANNLDSLQTASGIEADPATRIWEAWYQQELRSDNKLDVKIGQQSLDQEFMVNQNSLMFVNTMFGWPMLPSANMPGGGPAYPLSALGVRFRAKPTDSLTLLGGVFNGSPTRSNIGDPQLNDHSGTSLPLNGGVLAIGEAQYVYPGLGAMVYGDKPQPLARTIKVGAWYNSEKFDDLATDAAGLSLADPQSSGIPQSHKGNYAVYGTIDQMISQSKKDPYKTVSAFARAMGTPLGHQNLIAFSADAGLTFHEPIRHRRDDTLGLGMGYTKVSSAASALDAATAQYSNSFYPIRGSETFAEATYQWAPFPWLQVQPDLQYVMNPGAGLVNPNIPNHRIGNETVLGIRTIIQL